jgi:hypothetical protein
VPSDCLGGNGLVGDGFEGSGDLDSILCPLGGNEVEGMVDIFVCELAGPTTRGLWEVGTVLGTNLGYSKGANTLREFDFVHRIARDKKRDDVVSFVVCDGLHCSDGNKTWHGTLVYIDK